MCTLVVGFRHFSSRPLVVLANRDERLDRASEAPRRWAGEPFVAPRDRVAGGTWLGLTDHGLFVGITNRSGVANDPARRSRGELVARALRAQSARALHARLSDLDAHVYNAFHLLYVDADAAFITWSDGERVVQDTLGPGIHVVTERSLGANDEGRTEAILARLRALGPDATGDALEETMRRHGDPNPIEGTCVHMPQLGYGTRSSMTLFVDEKGPKMRWAEGKPCVTPYVEVPLATEKE